MFIQKMIGYGTTTNRLKNEPKQSGIAPRTDPKKYCPQRFSLRKSCQSSLVCTLIYSTRSIIIKTKLVTIIVCMNIPSNIPKTPQQLYRFSDLRRIIAKEVLYNLVYLSSLPGSINFKRSRIEFKLFFRLCTSDLIAPISSVDGVA